MEGEGGGREGGGGSTFISYNHCTYLLGREGIYNQATTNIS